MYLILRPFFSITSTALLGITISVPETKKSGDKSLICQMVVSTKTECSNVTERERRGYLLLSATLFLDRKVLEAPCKSMKETVE